MRECHTARCIARPIAVVFDLIADIESYPRFVPGWREAHTIERLDGRELVSQSVSLAGIRVEFTSTALIDRPHRLEIRSDTPPFRLFRLLWTLAPHGDAETIVRAQMNLAFQTSVLDKLADRLMPKVLERTIEAFTRQAAHPPLIAKSPAG